MTDFDALIDASSLGTPGAKALRSQTPTEVRDRIRAGIVLANHPNQRNETMWTEEEELALGKIREAVDAESATLRLRKPLENQLDLDRIRDLADRTEGAAETLQEFIDALIEQQEALTERAQRIAEVAEKITEARDAMSEVEGAEGREEKADARDQFLTALSELVDAVDTLEDGDLDDPADIYIEAELPEDLMPSTDESEDS